LCCIQLYVLKTDSLSLCTLFECNSLPHLRVLDEISEVLCERQSVTAEDLEEMNYLEQVSFIVFISCPW